MPDLCCHSIDANNSHMPDLRHCTVQGVTLCTDYVVAVFMETKDQPAAFWHAFLLLLLPALFPSLPGEHTAFHSFKGLALKARSEASPFKFQDSQSNLWFHTSVFKWKDCRKKQTTGERAETDKQSDKGGVGEPPLLLHSTSPKYFQFFIVFCPKSCKVIFFLINLGLPWFNKNYRCMQLKVKKINFFCFKSLSTSWCI